METNKTYNHVQYELNKLNETMELYNNLHTCGIALNKVHYYEKPKCSSEYSMGEKIEVCCNGITIQVIDDRQYYAKSCKWQEKHGYILLNFSKKDLKRYVEIGVEMEKVLQRKEMEAYWGLMKERKELIKKSYIANKSVVKKFYV